MTRDRVILSSRLRASVAVFFWVTLGVQAQAAVPVHRPTDDAQIVLHLASNNTQAPLARLRLAVGNAPQDVAAVARYVDALVASGKQSGNERYFGYAEQALNDAPTEVQRALTLTQAQLLQHRHEFRSAELLLNDLLAREPRHRDARLMRAQLRLHLHEPEQAMRDCVALMPLVDLLTSTTCFAQARAALGDVPRAYALVTTTLQAQSAPDAARSFSAGVAAEFAARLGRNDDASKWYRLSFELDRQSHYPRIVYADWLLSQGKHREALVIARTGASSADKLRVVLAEQNPQSVTAQQLQLAWAEARANGERNHLRDQARFELLVLRDPARAHATALDNFRDHRDAEDALLLFATATTVGDKSSVAYVRSWCAGRRYVDVRIDNVTASSS